MACDRLIADATTVLSSSTVAEGVLGRGAVSELAILSQVDHAQLTAVALLQHLRCAATGDAGRLAITDANSWPEVRLATTSAPSSSSQRALLTTLPVACPLTIPYPDPDADIAATLPMSLQQLCWAES